MAAGRETTCRDAVSKDPWNTGAWDGLVNAVASSGNVEKQRKAFDDLLAKFPHAVRSQRLYSPDISSHHNSEITP